MQDFLREMFVLGGGDEDGLRDTEIYQRAGEIDKERIEINKARGKPARKKT